MQDFTFLTRLSPGFFKPANAHFTEVTQNTNGTGKNIKTNWALKVGTVKYSSDLDVYFIGMMSPTISDQRAVQGVNLTCECWLCNNSGIIMR